MTNANPSKNKYFVFVVAAVFVVAGAFFTIRKNKTSETNKQMQAQQLQLRQKNKTQVQSENSDVPATSVQNQKTKFVDPIANASARITKKPFGIFITPQNSPVQPERFRGYHTGVDLETYAEEADVAVAVHAFCAGSVKYESWVSGYGGVLIQSCTVENQQVTVLYGHLNIASVSLKIGDSLNSGDVIGNLGAGYSQQTDGERKHLHLSIHKGNNIALLGYVQNKRDLSAWIDPMSYLAQ